MKITVDMPAVARCDVRTCAYNVESGCHARAITVGHGDTPGCDTFLKAAAHTRDRDRQAGVGACKVTSCKYNEDYECYADKIVVGYNGGEVACQTFAPREIV